MTVELTVGLVLVVTVELTVGIAVVELTLCLDVVEIIAVTLKFPDILKSKAEKKK